MNNPGTGKPGFSWKRLRLAVGVFLAVVAAVTAAALIAGSYKEWKDYYDEALAEKEYNKYIQSLPLELVSISAALADDVVYYDNDTAEPEVYDFVVMANFTEKGRGFSRELSATDFTIQVPDNFARDGGTIVFTYVWTPEATGDEPPVPVEKQTELNITLVQPDETVFKLIEAPTYTQEGYAENINGERKILPVLNDVNYDYTESDSDGIARFRYEELNITIKKPLMSEISFKLTSSSRTEEYNNVNYNFLANIPDATLAFDEEAQSFVISAEAGRTVTLNMLKAENGSITIAGEGSVSVATTLTAANLTVKSGATLLVNTEGVGISADSLNFERGSTVNVSTSGDGISLYGSAELYGTLNVTYAPGTKANTGICAQTEDVVIEIGFTADITIKDYEWGIAKFSGDDDGKVLFPFGYSGRKTGTLEDGETPIVYYSVTDGSGERNILSMINVTTTWLNRLTEATISPDSDYTVTMQPTLESTGLAKAEGKDDIILPALNGMDYAFSDDGETTTFVHYETGISFAVSVPGERLTLGGNTYNSLTAQMYLSSEDMQVTYADGAFTLTVAAGKTVEYQSGITATKDLIIAGKGELLLNGQLNLSDGMLTVKSGADLTVINGDLPVFVSACCFEEGSTVNVTTTSGDGIELNVNGKDRVSVFGGTLNITREAYGNTTGIVIRNTGIEITLSSASRITVTNFQYLIGRWNIEGANNKLNLPFGTQATAAGELAEGEICSWYIVDGDGRQKILVVNNSDGTATGGGVIYCVDVVIAQMESGYAVTKAPTLTETGEATLDGHGTIVLPALNRKEYSFAGDDGTKVTFTHYATGLTFDVAVEGERLALGGVTYNSLTAQMYLSGDIAASYKDGVYTLTVAKGKTAEYQSGLTAADIVIAGEGTLSLHGRITASGSLTVKSGASLTIEGGTVISAGEIVFEAGSYVYCSITEDGIIITGDAKLLGTLYVAAAPNSGKTGLVSSGTNHIDIELGYSSDLTFENLSFAMGMFANQSRGTTIFYPYGFSKVSDSPAGTSYITVTDGSGTRNILTVISVENGLSFCAFTEKTKDYGGFTVTTQPGLGTTGVAESADGAKITLPALNRTDYSYAESGNEVTFTHYETGLAFTVTVDESLPKITINGTAYNWLVASVYLSTEDMRISFADGVYTITVAADKTAEFTSLSADSLVIAGEGTVASGGTLNAKVMLTVKSGASLTVSGVATALDVGGILFEEGSYVHLLTNSASANSVYLRGNGKLLGTLIIKNEENKGTTAFEVLGDSLEVELSETSRIVFENFTFGFGSFSNAVHPRLVKPATTTSATSSELQEGETAVWFMLDGNGNRQKLIIWVNCSSQNCNMQ